MLSQVLNCFWQLASNSIDVRIENATILTQACEAAESNESKTRKRKTSSESSDTSLEACSPLTQYCLKRLIKGLSSSRDSARQGFSLALSGLVSLVKEKCDVSVLPVALYMAELFSMKDGQDVIGHLFGIGAIVESNVKFSTSDIEYLTNQLVQLGNAKSFVKEASVEVIIKLGYQIKDDEPLLRAYFTCKKLREILQMDPKDSSTPPELVTLGIHLWPLMPKQVAINCRVLPERKDPPSMDFIPYGSGKVGEFTEMTSNASKHFFSKSHMEYISECVRATTSTHPHVHSCWESMLCFMLPGYTNGTIKTKVNLESLKNFWNVLVENNLFHSPSHERKFLGITLFKLILPYLDEPATECLVTQKFIRCLGNNINKQTYLNKASIQAVELLAAKIKSSPDWDAEEMLSKVNQYSGNQLSHVFRSNGVVFDKAEQAKSSASLNIFESFIKSKADKASFLAYISRIPGIVKKHQSEPESFEELFKALVDVYLTNDGTLPDQEEDTKMKTIGCLLNAIGILSKVHSSIESLVRLEVRILEHLETKLQASDCTNKVPSDSLTRLRVNMMSNADKSDPKKMFHFLHLICLLELYSFINPQTIDEELTNDLENISKECFATSGRKEASSADDILWQDVLVDCMLSIISRNEAPYPSAPLRDSAESLFRYYSTDISRNGLTTLLDVLVQSLDETPQEKELGEDDEEVEMATEMEASDEEDFSTEVSDDINEDDDTIESDMEVDLPDATDEQMFKMDSILGAYFSSHTNTKSRKQLKEDSINFKLRVMNCLEIFMRINPDSPFLLEAPKPMLTSLANFSKPDGSQVLKERLVGLIKNKLCKCRCREAEPSNTDEENIKEQLRKSLYLASRSPMKVLADSAAAAYTFLQRCLHHHTEHLQHIADESLEACISDYFTKKKSKLTKSFLPDLFKKIPELAKISLPMLMEQCSSGRSAYLKTEALILVGNLMQMVGSEEARDVLRQNEKQTSQMLKSSQELLGSGKKKEIQKVLSKVQSLITETL